MDVGKAYIAAEAGQNLTELLWQPPNVNAPWNVSMNNDTAKHAKFYIITSSNAYESAGFQRDNDTAPTGASMTGFTKCAYSLKPPPGLDSFHAFLFMTSTVSY